MSHAVIPKTASLLGKIGLGILTIAAFFQYNYNYKHNSFLLSYYISNTSSTTSNTADNTNVAKYYTVTKVTDGDTIHINMNGIDEKVRLIGINTPETVDPRTTVQCFGKEASDRMKSLANGKIVSLEFDDSQNYRDSYGRLLAYVYLEDGQMLNRKMIADGYAYEYTYMTPYKYQKEFRELQTFARTSGRGLWAKDTCNGNKTLQK